MAEPRVALVTGASGGLGSVMARRFAEGGDVVYAGFNRGAERAQAVVDELTAAGHTVHALQLDLASTAAVEEAFARIGEESGRSRC